MNIEFFTEDIAPSSFQLSSIQKKNIRTWLASIIKGEGYELTQLSYIFCTDEYLHQINQEYLNHDTFTDIITFNISEEKGIIESDIFISIDRVKENCTIQETEFDDELARVMVHGVLHLLGWDDKTEAHKKEMRLKEDACLSLRN